MPVYPVGSVDGRPVAQAVPGLPAYMLGSLNRLVAPTRMNISTVALAGTTATVVGTVVEGNAPVVNQQVTIRGAVPSYFNVNNATILTVTQVDTPDDGVWSITFSLTNSNIVTTSSPGIAVAPQQEVGDSVQLGGGGTWYSVPVSIQSNTGPNDGRSMRFDANFPSTNGSATITAQTASICDGVNDNFQDLGTVATLANGVVTGGSLVVTEISANFTRLKVSGTAGTATVVGKVLV